MDFGSSALLLLLTCTLIHILHSLIHARISRTRKLPPQPSILTMMGNLENFLKSPQQTLAKLAETYGPIMRFKIGQGTPTTIIISSPDMVREVFQTNDVLFLDRPVPDVTTVHNHNRFSLAFLPASAPLWQDFRKICHNNLFSTKTLNASQDLRREKVRDLIRDVRHCNMKGEAIDIGRAAFKTFFNLLSCAFLSQDLIHSLDDDNEIMNGVMTLAKAIGTPNLVDFIPFLKMLDPQGMRRHTANQVTKFFNTLDELIEERSKLRQEKHYVTNNDMLDSLLSIADENSQLIDKEKIRHLFLDLLVAGLDTTSYGLERAMAELLHNPKAMSNAKKELEETIGKGNPVEELDIGRLPYLEAVIKEGLRLHPPAPLLVPRIAKKDVELKSGYTIPKGAQVLTNEWSIGRNPSVWGENANSFSPERFLGSEIDVKGHHFQLTPFGSGRRKCPGSPLALRIIPLMLGSLINSFDWKLENNLEPKDMDLDKPLRAIPYQISL